MREHEAAVTRARSFVHYFINRWAPHYHVVGSCMTLLGLLNNSAQNLCVCQAIRLLAGEEVPTKEPSGRLDDYWHRVIPEAGREFIGKDERDILRNLLHLFDRPLETPRLTWREFDREMREPEPQ